MPPSPPPPTKRMRPLVKSASLMLRVEAAKPATSITAPAPNAIPEGLMRKTRPFDCSVPRMLEGFCDTTRLSTPLAAFCWMKRVISSFWIENCCQLMIAPGELVIVRLLPLEENVALPAATLPPDGFAKSEVAEAAKAAPTANEMARARGWKAAVRRRRPPCGFRAG